jgi:dihydroorotase
VLFDVGHGGGAVLVSHCVPAIQRSFLPDTISTDIHKGASCCTRASMTTAMSKLLNIGMTLEQIIERTTVNPAKAIHRPELGTLGRGRWLTFAVLELQTGKFGFWTPARQVDRR